MNKNGIFAIIFNPSMKIDSNIRKEVYCGIICKNKRAFFIGVFIGLPILALLNFFFYYFFERYLEDENLKMKNIFVNKKMQEIENVNMDFKG